LDAATIAKLGTTYTCGVSTDNGSKDFLINIDASDKTLANGDEILL